MSMDKVWEFLIELLVSLGTRIITAVLILTIGMKLIKVFKKWIKTTKKLEKIDPGVRTFFSSFLGITAHVILFISVAMILGIPTTSFVTALASCGVAIGLAMQGALGNLAGGIMILIFKPFAVGDYIVTENAAGTVTNITIMYTVLTTPDNKHITIPNGTLTNSVIENHNASLDRRVDIVFSADYACDAEKVKGILLSVARKNEKIFQTPEPFARLTNHGASALEYTLRVWCRAEEYWDVKFDLLEAVKKEFEENDISIPYPQMDIHIAEKIVGIKGEEKR